ncbi:hypothetical protein [Streptomyces sp. NPDC005799]|uniref:hypothetical protein n=1 Tax=Streptomyces sp. NPDC005799 TaxID=3154678 RepID=UPI0033CC4FC6
MNEPITPVDEDVNANSAELLARAATDYRVTQTAGTEQQNQGGTGIRQGVLPGGTR